jgi:hypothetical protein
MRVMIAVLVGTLVAVVGFQIAAVAALLVTIGIPLGSSGDPPGADYFVLNLLGALAASALGGVLTRRLAPEPAWRPNVVLAALLAGIALWGFTRPSSHWPGWYAPVLAAIAMIGVLAPRAWRRRRALGDARSAAT